MSELRYTKSHEWVRLEGSTATVGISHYAQEQLGDVVYVELPAVGKILAGGKEAAVVESVKAASEIYAPLSGNVSEANAALADQPSLVNEDPEGAGWFFRMTVTETGELAGLMDQAAYEAYLAELR